jgi:hypothetical protein
MNLKNHRDRLDILLSMYEREIREAEEQLSVLQARGDKPNVMTQQLDQPKKRPSRLDKSWKIGVPKAIRGAFNDLWRRQKDPVTIPEIKPIGVRV